MVLLEGAPLLLIELGIGQKLRQGSLGTWTTIHPAIAGIGVGKTSFRLPTIRTDALHGLFDYPIIIMRK